MRPLVLLALLPALAGAAGPLQIVNPIVSQSEGGAPDPPGFEHVAGESLWARFDITGFKLAENNRVDVSYVFSVLSADGRVLYTQPEPAMEQSESFYPKRYVPAEFSLNLQRSVHPGEYTLAVQVKDAVGKQSYQAKYGFTVE